MSTKYLVVPGCRSGANDGHWNICWGSEVRKGVQSILCTGKVEGWGEGTDLLLCPCGLWAPETQIVCFFGGWPGGKITKFAHHLRKGR
jgi:hypothetical protein